MKISVKNLKKLIVEYHEIINEDLSPVSEMPEEEFIKYLYGNKRLSSQHDNIILKVKSRLRDGNYSENEAPGLFIYWINNALKLYAISKGEPDHWESYLNDKTRDELAKKISKDEYEKIQKGEYDELVNVPATFKSEISTIQQDLKDLEE